MGRKSGSATWFHQSIRGPTSVFLPPFKEAQRRCQRVGAGREARGLVSRLRALRLGVRISWSTFGMGFEVASSMLGVIGSMIGDDFLLYDDETDAMNAL